MEYWIILQIIILVTMAIHIKFTYEIYKLKKSYKEFNNKFLSELVDDIIEIKQHLGEK